MQVKKYYVIIPMLLIIAILLACSKKDAEVIVNRYIKADSENKVDGLGSMESNLYSEKLVTTSATDKIKFVNKENKVFWNTIKYNYIDNQYNETKVQKDNIRICRKANIKYAEQWIQELTKTYKYLKEEIREDLGYDLEQQYKNFMKYYNASKDMYLGILISNNNYDGVIDGFDSVRQFYTLADEAREYTILLKEYIFIETGEIDFYTDQSVKVKSDNHRYAKVDIKTMIIDDQRVKDIMVDNYSSKIECSVSDLTRTKATKKAESYRNYWDDEVKHNYDNVAETFNKEDKKVLENQKDGYYKYLKFSKKIHKDILKDSNVVDFEYSKNIDIENAIFQGQGYMKYNTLLIEYYYLLTEKIDL